MSDGTDPRPGAPIVLDTHIDEPSATAGEVEMMLFVLERSRAQFAWKAGGLDAAGLRATLAPSLLSLGGLLKHLALCEDARTARDLDGGPLGAPWAATGLTGEALWEWAWDSAASDSPEALYGLWQSAVGRARAAWRAAIDDRGLDGPSRCTWPDGSTVNLRRSLADLHDEYARHVGHADLLRESIDGLVGEDPPS